MRDFRRLAVWEKSRELVLALYRTTKLFPREEIMGDAAPPLRQISPKDVAAKETANSIGSCRSQPVPEANGGTICF